MGCTLEDTNEKINLLLREPTTIQSERSSTDLLVALIGFFLNNCASSSHVFFFCNFHSSIVALAEIQTSLSFTFTVCFCLFDWVGFPRICCLALG